MYVCGTGMCDVCVCAWDTGIYVSVYMCMGVVYDICFIYYMQCVCVWCMYYVDV